MSRAGLLAAAAVLGAEVFVACNPTDHPVYGAPPAPFDSGSPDQASAADGADSALLHGGAGSDGASDN
ncbi:MAG: hypothetical protein R3B13_36995 [Polyangiaceae bacterium]